MEISKVNFNLEYAEIDGETRLRFTSPKGIGYRLTENKNGGWQNAHFHVSTYETYIVQEGWIQIFFWPDVVSVSLFETDSLTVKPCEHHVVYCSPNNITHVVKHGNKDYKEKDWFSSPVLEKLKPELLKQVTKDSKIDKRKY